MVRSLSGSTYSDTYRPDPRARQFPSATGNWKYSIITDPNAFIWGDDTTLPRMGRQSASQSFTTDIIRRQVIYELHMGSVGSPNTFTELYNSGLLDYLQALGVTALELMPLNEVWGMYGGWGYNPSYLYAVEQAYGSPAQLKTLVRECHKRGIGVIMDLVVNHIDTSWKNGIGFTSFERFDGWYEVCLLCSVCCLLFAVCCD